MQQVGQDLLVGRHTSVVETADEVGKDTIQILHHLLLRRLIVQLHSGCQIVRAVLVPLRVRSHDGPLPGNQVRGRFTVAVHVEVLLACPRLGGQLLVFGVWEPFL